MDTEPVSFTKFELGQLYALLGPSQLSKLSPDLRQKLRGEFRRIQLDLPKLAIEDDDEPVYPADAQ
jgi:hypothetical protein